jgi:hypothetical protein
MLKKTKLFLTSLLIIIAMMQNVIAEGCSIEQIGSLDSKLIDEASGIAVSKQFKDRLYHVNDSGDGAYFYVTDLQGNYTQKVKISGFFPLDVEDLALAKCPGENKNQCIYIADIGDNYKLRPIIKIIVIEEQGIFKKKVSPYRTYSLTYPDAKENAEAFFVNPVNGEFYIISKGYNEISKKISDATLYRLPKQQVDNYNFNLKKLEKVGTLPITSWQSDVKEKWSKLATAADINQKGDKLLILTYNQAFELTIENDPESHIKWTNEIVRHDIKRLFQQEAISYIPNSNKKEFIYSTESKKNGDAKLMKVSCNK